MKDEHINKHDGIYVIYLTVISTILIMLGSSLAYQG